MAAEQYCESDWNCVSEGWCSPGHTCCWALTTTATLLLQELHWTKQAGQVPRLTAVVILENVCLANLTARWAAGLVPAFTTVLWQSAILIRNGMDYALPEGRVGLRLNKGHGNCRIFRAAMRGQAFQEYARQVSFAVVFDHPGTQLVFGTIGSAVSHLSLRSEFVRPGKDVWQLVWKVVVRLADFTHQSSLSRSLEACSHHVATCAVLSSGHARAHWLDRILAVPICGCKKTLSCRSSYMVG
jgi:hypothetical protein